MNKIVAIVGRPNVGKSTFFNRLVGTRQAIVNDESGVTRDRQYGVSDWNGKTFSIVDTGGFVHGSDDIFEAAIRRQVNIAVEEAQVIIFMTDAQTGITAMDSEVARMLRQSKKEVLLMVNKVDNHKLLMEANEFWSLGFEKVFFVSSTSGSGTGDLLDEVVKSLPMEDDSSEALPKFAVVGQPNAGKSTLINSLLGEERNIVTDIAGTTRDAIHTHYEKFGHKFTLVDTAGIRKKKNVHEDLEFYSVMRAISAIDECDVCLLVIDATMGLESQDMSIIRLAQKRNKGLVVLFNKWDLVEKDTNTAKKYTEQIKEKLAPFNDVPILFISSTEKQRIFKTVEEAMHVYENRVKKISTSKLNEVLQEAMEKINPPTYRGHFIKIKYATQLTARYPAFALFCNYPKHVPDSYKQYLENQLRNTFDFTGVPIALFFREK